MTTTTMQACVLGALRSDRALTFPEILSRMGGGHFITKTVDALGSLVAAGRVERLTLESGGWRVSAWRLTSHAEARSPQRDPTNSVCSAPPAPPRETVPGSEVPA